MQQAKEEFPKITRSISSPPLICREVPRKHYLKKEPNDENNIMWQPISEVDNFILYYFEIL